MKTEVQELFQVHFNEVLISSRLLIGAYKYANNAKKK